MSLIAPRPTATLSNQAYTNYSLGVYDVSLVIALSNVTNYYGLSKAVGFASAIVGTASKDLSTLTVTSTCYASSMLSFAVDVANSLTGYLNNPQSIEVACVAQFAPIGSVNVSMLQTTLNGGQAVTYVNPTSSIGYMDSAVNDVLGSVYLSRIYAKDLSAIEIASSGKVSFSPNDAHSLDMYTSQSADASSTLSSTSVIETVKDSLLMTTQDGAASLFLDSITQSAELSSATDIHLTAASNIYMSAQNLIINVSSMTTSYAFAVAPTGELQLQQQVQQLDGSTNTRVVARFGVKTATTATASNLVSIL